MRATDAVLRAIEAAYAPIADERAWLQGILDQAVAVDVGPWCGYVVDGNDVRSFAGAFPIETQRILRGALTTSEPMLRAGHAPAPPVEIAKDKWRRITARFGWTLDDLRKHWGFDIPQITAVLGTDTKGRGVFSAVAREVEFAPRTKRLLYDLAAHVNAAFRLRERLDVSAPEAVLAPDGQVLDAAPPAVRMRGTLASAVKDMDRARGKLRRLRPEEAVEKWRAMVDGRWSLVDRTERDGKRLVLAYRNEAASNVASLRGTEAQVATLAALGHSNKYIAYELGLKESTVATHLRRALAKLSLEHRRDLIEVYGALAELPRGARALASDA